MTQDYLHRDCPICQDKIPFTLEVSSMQKAEDLNYDTLVPYWNGFFKDKILLVPKIKFLLDNIFSILKFDLFLSMLYFFFVRYLIQV